MLARGSVVDWGNMPQAGRSRVQFPVSLGLSINLILPARILLGGGGGEITTGANCELIVYKMWEPRRLTALRASTACYKDNFTLLHWRRHVREGQKYSIRTGIRSDEDFFRFAKQSTLQNYKKKWTYVMQSGRLTLNRAGKQLRSFCHGCPFSRNSFETLLLLARLSLPFSPLYRRDSNPWSRQRCMTFTAHCLKAEYWAKEGKY
jgi:hypothetical protein